MPRIWRDNRVHMNPEGVRLAFRDVQRQTKSFVDKFTVVDKTSDFTLTSEYLASILTNTGASGTVTYTLPAARQGYRFTFIRTASYALRIAPNGTETIRGGQAGGYVQIDNDGDTLSLFCVTDGQWEMDGGNMYSYTYE